MLCYQPSRREDNKVNYRLSWIIALTSQNGKYTRIRMIIAYRTNRIKFSQIISVRTIISMPSYYVERRVIEFIIEELS